MSIFRPLLRGDCRRSMMVSTAVSPIFSQLKQTLVVPVSVSLCGLLNPLVPMRQRSSGILMPKDVNVVAIPSAMESEKATIAVGLSLDSRARYCMAISSASSWSVEA